MRFKGPRRQAAPFLAEGRAEERLWAGHVWQESRGGGNTLSLTPTWPLALGSTGFSLGYPDCHLLQCHLQPLIGGRWTAGNLGQVSKSTNIRLILLGSTSGLADLPNDPRLRPPHTICAGSVSTSAFFLNFLGLLWVHFPTATLNHPVQVA